MNHTSSHTRPLHVLKRNGTFYFNRRVPKHAVEAFGCMIRVRLSDDFDEAKEIAEKLTGKLDDLWAGMTSSVDLSAVVDACRPQPQVLSRWAQEYVELKDIGAIPPAVALSALIEVVGDKDVRDYRREDARAFVRYLTKKGNSTGTIRRRVNSIAAILNYALAELDTDHRNPFSRVHIQGEGKDRQKRGTFTEGELLQGVADALSSGNRVRLLFPILAETGCRLGEVVGLRLEDIEDDRISLVPHDARRLKTSGSEREVPLVGVAQDAMHQLLRTCPPGSYLFGNYRKRGMIQATFASNVLNKWIKQRFPDRTAHCLRHTFRDRLRAVECPLEMIDALGGWSSIGTAGSRYGRGFRLEHKREWLERIRLQCSSCRECSLFPKPVRRFVGWLENEGG